MTEIHTITIDLPERVAQAVRREARRAGVSVDQWAAVAVADSIGRRDSAGFFRHRGADGDPERAIKTLRRAKRP